MPGITGRLRALWLLAALAGGSPLAAHAQLRPYEPTDWRVFEAPAVALVSFGASYFHDQRASLSGSTGSLFELGTLSATYRTGRVALTVEGTPVRVFSEKASFAPPYGGALPDDDGLRVDAGDFRISTALRLTSPDAPIAGILRFGARLPTTDNRVGLERDQTDFFAMLGGRVTSGGLWITAELGVGIHGTREAEYEQSDVLVYLFGAELREGRILPALLLLGHADGLADRSIRGNEELSEVRLRLRTAGQRWVQIEGIAGLTEFSPQLGVSLGVGALF